MMMHLAHALKQAAANPSKENVAAVLRSVSDEALKSEWGRRTGAKRLAREDPLHDPGNPDCRCIICIMNDPSKAPQTAHRHKHIAIEGTHRYGVQGDLPCALARCKASPQTHVISRCRCGAIGVSCPKTRRTNWHKL
jgi:hypothetical protein